MYMCECRVYEGGCKLSLLKDQYLSTVDRRPVATASQASLGTWTYM